eukprot:2194322-Rhodomonas_salina.2
MACPRLRLAFLPSAGSFLLSPVHAVSSWCRFTCSSVRVLTFPTTLPGRRADPEPHCGNDDMGRGLQLRLHWQH